MTEPSRSLPLVALVLGAAILVVQIRVIAGGHTFDDVRYHSQVAPPRLAAAEAVQHGELPAWWDGSGLGVPLLGEPSHGALYPPTWLAATPRALDLVVVAHLLWAALGVAVWARRRASDRGALLAGVLAATTGIAMSAALRGALPALAHLPWLAAAVEWLVHAPTARARSQAAFAIGALVGAIALVGELALLVDAIALAVALAFAPRSPGGRTGHPWRWLVAAIGGGLAIGAVQWLPAALALPDGAGAVVSGLPLARLVELVIPGAFGGSASDHAIAAIAGASPWAPSLYIGAPLIALATVRAPPRGMPIAIGVLAGAALVIGRGGWPAWLGAPELHIAVLAIVLAAFAAPGLDALVLGQRRAVLALTVGAAFAALCLMALGGLRIQHPELARPVDRALLDGGLGIACMAGAILLAWRAPGRHLAVLFALLVAPSVGAAHAISPTVDRVLVSEPPAWAQLAEHVPRPARAFLPITLHDRPELEDAIAMFAGDSAWRWGIAAARSEDPARPRLHDRTWLAAAREGGALLDRYGIVLAVLPVTVVRPRELTALGRRGHWSLVELPVAPPASVMYGWRWLADPDEALARLFPAGGGTGIQRGAIALRGSGTDGPPSPAPVPCTIHTWQRGTIELTCVADAPGYAAVSSTAAAGWTVSVDGEPQLWQIADVLRRAVEIPAGTHRIRWTFAPPGQDAGAFVALAGLLVLIALWALGWRGARRVGADLVN